MNNMKDYRPVRSVAQARNVTERALKSIIKKHHIPARKLGSLLYIDVRKLDQYLAETEFKPRPRSERPVRRGLDDWY